MSSLQLTPPGVFHIREDPHNASKRWQEWSANLKRFVAASGISDEAQKREILLYTAGKEINEVYKEIHKPPAAGATPTLDEFITELSEHFAGRDNIVFLRYQFRCCHQMDGEAIDAWYNRLCEAADSCNFKALRDSLIRDQIVACCRSDTLRKRLLNVPNIDLEETLRLARTHEAANHQAVFMQRSSSDETVQALQNRRQQQPWQLTSSSTSVKCLRCGDFGHKTCNRAQGKRCGKCGKENHLAKACLGGQKRVHMLQPRTAKESSDEELFHIQADGHFKATFDVLINQRKTKVLIDSGSSCNVISLEIFKNLGGSVSHLDLCKTRVYPFCAEAPLPVIGQVEMNVETNGKKKRAPFFVIDKRSKTILGRETSGQIDMLRIGPPDSSKSSIQIASMTTENPEDQHLPEHLRLNNILKEFEDRFKGIGCVKGLTIDIRLKEGAPVCQPPSRVPVHLRDAVKEELQKIRGRNRGTCKRSYRLEFKDGRGAEDRAWRSSHHAGSPRAQQIRHPRETADSDVRRGDR